MYGHRLTHGKHRIRTARVGAVERGCKQVAQLSQRDRAAGWVSYGQKWKTVNWRQYFRTL